MTNIFFITRIALVVAVPEGQAYYLIIGNICPRLNQNIDPGQTAFCSIKVCKKGLWVCPESGTKSGGLNHPAGRANAGDFWFAAVTLAAGNRSCRSQAADEGWVCPACQPAAECFCHPLPNG
jgi:hypothetical protein